MSRDERLHSRLAMTMADERQADFGTFLRRAREQHGVSLQQLAIDTKISTRVLEALERNDPSKLPGGLFSRAFVRAYAREVGLDPEVAVASFVSAFPNEAGAEDMPSATSAVEAESFEHRRRVVKALLRVAGVLLLAAVLAVAYYSWMGRKAPSAAPHRGLPSAAAPAAPAILPAPTAVPPSAPAGATAAPAQSPAASLPQQPAAGPAQAPPAAAVPAAPLVVVLTTAESCWMWVSVDGVAAAARTFAAGERAEFNVQRSMTLKAGNAGALGMTLNGKPARALGAQGQVITTTIPAAGYESFLR
jgi:cytoskeleton protein RodZ